MLRLIKELNNNNNNQFSDFQGPEQEEQEEFSHLNRLYRPEESFLVCSEEAISNSEKSEKIN